MVQRHRTLSARTPQLHLRPSAACRIVLCAGSRFDDSRPHCAHIHQPTRAHARPLCSTGRQVDSPACSPSRRIGALLERTYAHPCTDTERKPAEVRTRRRHRNQQLSARLSQGWHHVRRNTCRRAVLGRGNVSQGRRCKSGMEPAECGQLLAAATRDCERYMEMSATRRTAHLLYLHVQCARRRGERGVDSKRTGCRHNRVARHRVVGHNACCSRQCSCMPLPAGHKP